jgi:predicted phage tail component-like protein
MVPYLIINGVSSKTINGLLIQSLPPISKPKLRATLEEIDGRDGDIAEILGYAAYDKTISIGLRGDYDVDEVISFFNTKGKITFSNELDKYYRFATYNQIDFERLIRFRTANVTIHVQPYKYSVDQSPIIWTNRGSETLSQLRVLNTGNTVSTPIITITGSGTINIYVNNQHVLKCELAATGETIIIDADTMNATDPEGNFLNRQVTGDYNDIKFSSGSNKLSITGNVSKATIERYSRWI